jgi:hypothetical protein
MNNIMNMPHTVDARYSVFNDIRGNQHNTTNIPTPPQPLQATRSQEVGARKTITTTAALYRDGTLLVNVFTDCQNHFYGLRGRVLVVVRDGDGHALGVSSEMCCETRGGLLDIFTPSSGRQTFSQKFSDDVSGRAVALDIWQSDGEPLGSTLDHILKVGQSAVAIAKVLN